MNSKRSINVSYPLNGGTMVVSFCFERAALAFVREEGLKTYKITCGDRVLRREGL